MDSILEAKNRVTSASFFVHPVHGGRAALVAHEGLSWLMGAMDQWYQQIEMGLQETGHCQQYCRILKLRNTLYSVGLNKGSGYFKQFAVPNYTKPGYYRDPIFASVIEIKAPGKSATRLESKKTVLSLQSFVFVAPLPNSAQDKGRIQVIESFLGKKLY